MEFEEFWDKHGNQYGDDATLGMIRKYGIKSVKLIAENAWLFAREHAPNTPIKADHSHLCEFCDGAYGKHLLGCPNS